ncbi:uncharacterized protein LOC131006532 [Salvia miltiorrhiza]|uniref:uncharacterized protein LOC131006532 n=1 Tax=Salvia miltiorrhiza TaxID=226208 RepID=UPI0025AC5624|nr:uncharacterized protein LOC131006532 [Salvia miltiorrhiza]
MYYLFLLCQDDVFIETWAWTLVEDLDEWNWFPWGSYTYQVLLHYLSLAGTRGDMLEKPAYHFFGPVLALQIRSYEAIPTLGSTCGTRNSVPKFPRALMWTTRKALGDFTYFFDKELIVHESLQPSPEELDEVYSCSLDNGDMLHVRFVPPLRLTPKKNTTHVPKRRRMRSPTLERDSWQVSPAVQRGGPCSSLLRDERHSSPVVEMRERDSSPRVEMRDSPVIDSTLTCCHHGVSCRDSGKDCHDYIDQRLARMLHDESDDGFIARRVLSGLKKMLDCTGDKSILLSPRRSVGHVSPVRSTSHVHHSHHSTSRVEQSLPHRSTSPVEHPHGSLSPGEHFPVEHPHGSPSPIEQFHQSLSHVLTTPMQPVLENLFQGDEHADEEEEEVGDTSDEHVDDVGLGQRVSRPSAALRSPFAPITPNDMKRIKDAYRKFRASGPDSSVTIKDLGHILPQAFFDDIESFSKEFDYEVIDLYILFMRHKIQSRRGLKSGVTRLRRSY